MKRLSIHVTGKVQGVFYRASTERKAKEIGLTGFVRNQADGSVYIEAQGDEKQLSLLTEWCKHGPQQAEVASVNLSEKALIGEREFRILR